MSHPSCSALPRLLGTLERELDPLEVPWALLELFPEDRRRWTLTLRIGRIEGITVTSSPAELGPQLRSLLRRRHFPCPTCRTPQDLFRCPPTWTCACGTAGFLCPLEPEDPAWDALLTRLEPLLPEELCDAVLDSLEHGDSGPEEWFTGLQAVQPFGATATLYTLAPTVAFRSLSTLPPLLVLQLASGRLGLRVEEEDEEPAPTWRREAPNGQSLRWRLEPTLTLTLTDPLSPPAGGWVELHAVLLTWTDPLPAFATLDEAVQWLEARLQEALARGSAPPYHPPP